MAGTPGGEQPHCLFDQDGVCRAGKLGAWGLSQTELEVGTGRKDQEMRIFHLVFTCVVILLSTELYIKPPADFLTHLI